MAIVTSYLKWISILSYMYDDDERLNISDMTWVSIENMFSISMPEVLITSIKSHKIYGVLAVKNFQLKTIQLFFGF